MNYNFNTWIIQILYFPKYWGFYAGNLKAFPHNKINWIKFHSNFLIIDTNILPQQFSFKTKSQFEKIYSCRFLLWLTCTRTFLKIFNIHSQTLKTTQEHKFKIHSFIFSIKFIAVFLHFLCMDSLDTYGRLYLKRPNFHWSISRELYYGTQHSV